MPTSGQNLNSQPEQSARLFQDKQLINRLLLALEGYLTGTERQMIKVLKQILLNSQALSSMGR